MGPSLARVFSPLVVVGGLFRARTHALSFRNDSCCNGLHSLTLPGFFTTSGFKKAGHGQNWNILG